jgi:26S proteasome regulatory subunit N2
MPNNYTSTCNSIPSAFAYPKKLLPPKKEIKKMTETAVLSITAKAKARAAKKEKAKEGGEDDAKMDTSSDSNAAASSATATADDEKKEGTDDGDDNMTDAADELDKEGKSKDGEDGDEDEGEKKEGPEPESFTLSNPTRVTRNQEPLISFDSDNRYQPVTRNAKPVGIVILTDRTPDEEEDVATVDAPPIGGDAEEEADPPEPFEWEPEDL